MQPDANVIIMTAKKHRGYAFITFSSAADAQEAIDNYDLNQLPGYQGSGKFLKCSLAQPSKYVDESGRNDRASEWSLFRSESGKKTNVIAAVWETEEWKAEHAGERPEEATE